MDLVIFVDLIANIDFQSESSVNELCWFLILMVVDGVAEFTFMARF